jgi:hypothetical protein
MFSVLMFSVVYDDCAQKFYSVACSYDKCRYAECRGAATLQHSALIKGIRGCILKTFYELLMISILNGVCY